jgi:hypothetical protein
VTGVLDIDALCGARNVALSRAAAVDTAVPDDVATSSPHAYGLGAGTPNAAPNAS